jgi:hypothetical protein
MATCAVALNFRHKRISISTTATIDETLTDTTVGHERPSFHVIHACYATITIFHGLLKTTAWLRRLASNGASWFTLLFSVKVVAICSTASINESVTFANLAVEVPLLEVTSAVTRHGGQSADIRWSWRNSWYLSTTSHLAHCLRQEVIVIASKSSVRERTAFPNADIIVVSGEHGTTWSNFWRFMASTCILGWSKGKESDDQNQKFHFSAFTSTAFPRKWSRSNIG